MRFATPDLSSTDGDHNRRVLQDALATDGAVMLPAGSTPLTGGLVLAAGNRLVGTPGAILEVTEPDERPVLHVLGSRARIRDLTIALPVSQPGPHDGARFTAITVGDYLYPSAPTWIDGVGIRRVRVVRPAQCPANSIAVMGAVRGLTLRDIRIDGGGTGIAVHWGAVATSVAQITGPSFHPHDLTIERLDVRDAFEAFYLSSVHDVDVRDVRCDNVEIGFRLLPGDNADAYHQDPAASQVSRRITVRDGRIGWHGIYAIRVAGWGRSEVDRSLRRLAYQDVSIRDLELTPMPATAARSRAAVVLEQAEGVRFAAVALHTADGVTDVTVDGQRSALAGVSTARARTR